MSKLNFAEMAQGAFIEQFDHELTKVLENIADPNTDPKKARKITLTATLKTDEERELVSFDVQSKSTLVPHKSLTTKIILDRNGDGSVVGAELLSGQKGQMFFDEEGLKDDRGNNVVNFNK